MLKNKLKESFAIFTNETKTVTPRKQEVPLELNKERKVQYTKRSLWQDGTQ